MKSSLGHLHGVLKLFAWYHEPSSSSSQDILLTRLLYYTKCQSRKREITQPNIYRICQTLIRSSTRCTQCACQISWSYLVVLQIFCWQGPLWVKFLSRKRGIIQSNIHRILRKVNQVIYIICKLYDWCHYPSSSGSPDILLTRLLYYMKCQSRKREVIQTSCWQDCFTIRNAKVGKGR